MSTKVAVNRLRKEYKCFESPPFIRAAPLESNLQEWHYVLQGPPDSPYTGGLYHGMVKVPWLAAAHATTHRPRGLLACSGPSSGPDWKAPRCFDDEGELWRAGACTHESPSPAPSTIHW